MRVQGPEALSPRLPLRRRVQGCFADLSLDCGGCRAASQTGLWTAAGAGL